MATLGPSILVVARVMCAMSVQLQFSLSLPALVMVIIFRLLDSVQCMTNIVNHVWALIRVSLGTPAFLNFGGCKGYARLFYATAHFHILKHAWAFCNVLSTCMEVILQVVHRTMASMPEHFIVFHNIYRPAGASCQLGSGSHGQDQVFPAGWPAKAASI